MPPPQRLLEAEHDSQRSADTVGRRSAEADGPADQMAALQRAAGNRAAVAAVNANSDSASAAPDPAARESLDRTTSAMLAAIFGDTTVMTSLLIVNAGALADSLPRSPGHRTARVAADLLIRIRRELETRAASAPRAPDGALLAPGIASDVDEPWAPSRPHSPADIPGLDEVTLGHCREVLGMHAPDAPGAARGAHGELAAPLSPGTAAGASAVPPATTAPASPASAPSMTVGTSATQAEASPVEGTSAGRAGAAPAGGGTEIQHGLSVLRGTNVGVAVDGVADALNRGNSEDSAWHGAAVRRPPNAATSLQQITQEVWYVAHSLYRVDHSGYIVPGDFHLDVDVLSLAPGTYFFGTFVTEGAAGPEGHNVMLRLDGSRAEVVSGDIRVRRRISNASIADNLQHAEDGFTDTAIAAQAQSIINAHHGIAIVVSGHRDLLEHEQSLSGALARADLHKLQRLVQLIRSFAPIWLAVQAREIAAHFGQVVADQVEQEVGGTVLAEVIGLGEFQTLYMMYDVMTSLLRNVADAAELVGLGASHESTSDETNLAAQGIARAIVAQTVQGVLLAMGHTAHEAARPIEHTRPPGAGAASAATATPTPAVESGGESAAASAPAPSETGGVDGAAAAGSPSSGPSRPVASRQALGTASTEPSLDAPVDPTARTADLTVEAWASTVIATARARGVKLVHVGGNRFRNAAGDVRAIAANSAGVPYPGAIANTEPASGVPGDTIVDPTMAATDRLDEQAWVASVVATARAHNMDLVHLSGNRFRNPAGEEQAVLANAAGIPYPGSADSTLIGPAPGVAARQSAPPEGAGAAVPPSRGTLRDFPARQTLAGMAANPAPAAPPASLSRADWVASIIAAAHNRNVEIIHVRDNQFQTLDGDGFEFQTNADGVPYPSEPRGVDERPAALVGHETGGGVADAPAGEATREQSNAREQDLVPGQPVTPARETGSVERVIPGGDVVSSRLESRGAQTGKLILTLRGDGPRGGQWLLKPEYTEASVAWEPGNHGITPGERYRRTAAAREVAQALNIRLPEAHVVAVEVTPEMAAQLPPRGQPPVPVRAGDVIQGSLTRWSLGPDGQELPTLGDIRESNPQMYERITNSQQFHDIAAFDYLLGSMDRHAFNFLVDGDPATGHFELIPIDNDMVLPNSPLRFLMFGEFQSDEVFNLIGRQGGYNTRQRPLPATVTPELAGQLRHMDSNRDALRNALAPFVPEAAIEGMFARLTRIIEALDSGTLGSTGGTGAQ